MSAPKPVLHLETGLRVRCGGLLAGLDPVTVGPGEWLLVCPPPDRPEPKLGVAVAKVLGTLLPPRDGAVELLGSEIGRLSYLDLQRIRTKIGYVQGSGGLLANRSVRDNVGLPLAVHGGLDAVREAECVQAILRTFGLRGVAECRPHELDGALRFRTCAARAVVLDPAWVVVEGAGDFAGAGVANATWEGLLAWRDRTAGAAAVCLGREAPAFERWFVEHGGRVLRWHDESTRLNSQDDEATA